MELRVVASVGQLSMVSIPDRLQALITSRPTETEGRMQIEIPKELVEHATVDPGEVYQVAVLPTEAGDAADDGRDTASSSDASASSTATNSEPPVKEGEMRSLCNILVPPTAIVAQDNHRRRRDAHHRPHTSSRQSRVTQRTTGTRTVAASRSNAGT